MRRAESEPYSRRTVTWLASIIGGSFALSILLTAYAEDLGDPTTAAPNSFSRSALGHHALATFLERSGVQLRVRRNERVDNLASGVPILVAEPIDNRFLLPDGADEDEDEGEEQLSPLRTLLEAADESRAPVVIVLPKWNGMPNPDRPRWLKGVSRSSRAATRVLDDLEDHLGTVFALGEAHLDGPTTCSSSWGDEVRVDLEHGALLETDPDIEPLLWCEAGVLIGSHLDDAGRETLVVADPDLFNTHGLGKADHALVAQKLLRDHFDAGQLVIDETIHGFTLEPGFLAELFRFPLVLAVAHALLVLALVVWAGLRRFGAPRREESALGGGKLVLIDNTAKLLSLSGNPAYALPAYFRGCVRDVAQHYHVPSELSRRQTIERLEELGEVRGHALGLRDIWERIERSKDSKRARRDTSVQLARQLHHWREGMLHVD